MTGILLLDKPVGISSNDALQTVKRLYRARKAGHTGSLDRLASGLLPLCLGEATKLSAFLLNADKHYVSTFRLGARTRTGDTEGEVIDTRPVPELSDARVRAAMAELTGPIEQVPPMHSAIKRQGRPLYELAHQGIEVERAPRPVTVYRFDLLARGPDTLEVDVLCSKGTYIRTLAEDLGEALGCGAHVAALRRLGSGPYEDAGMVSLEELDAVAEEAGAEGLDQLLLPPESALGQWPEVRLSGDLSFYVRQGQPVIVPRSPTTGWVRLYAEGDVFMGVGEVLDDGRIAPRRLVQS